MTSIYKAGDKVYIRKGYGFTDITRGINRFGRAVNDLYGVVYAVAPRRQIYITLEDGRKVITDDNCIIRDYRQEA